MPLSQAEQKLVDEVGRNAPDLETFLQEMVRVDSGSGDPAGIAAVGDVVRPRFETLGFHCREITGSAGRHLVFERTGSAARRKLLLVAHLDTVFEGGSFSGYRVDGEHAIGPGVVDCKGGVAVLFGFLSALEKSGELEQGEIRLVLNGDEETGSLTSRELIEETATGCEATLVFEGARPSGAVVNHRKGNGIYHLTARGVAAHSGVSHADGVSAIKELAYKILAIEDLTDYERDVTLNVGLVRGGTKHNVVPAEATAQVDIRFVDAQDGARVDAKLREICATPSVEGARVEVGGGLNRPPWPADDTGIATLTAAWIEAAADAGVAVEATNTGGGSDGNWTAAMGIPTLDGLGPVGGRYHTREEYLIRATLAERAGVAAVAVSRLLRG